MADLTLWIEEHIQEMIDRGTLMIDETGYRGYRLCQPKGKNKGHWRCQSKDRRILRLLPENRFNLPPGDYDTAKPPDVCPECGERCNFIDVTCYLPECGGPGHVDRRL